MAAAGISVGGSHCRHFTYLFNDGQAKPVATGVLIPFVKAGEYPAFVEGFGMSCIGNGETTRFEQDIDISGRRIVVAGVAEQVVQQDVDEIGAGVDRRFVEVRRNADPVVEPQLAELPDLIGYFFPEVDVLKVIELAVADLSQEEEGLVEPG